MLVEVKTEGGGDFSTSTSQAEGSQEARLVSALNEVCIPCTFVGWDYPLCETVSCVVVQLVYFSHQLNVRTFTVLVLGSSNLGAVSFHLDMLL